MKKKKKKGEQKLKLLIFSSLGEKIKSTKYKGVTIKFFFFFFLKKRRIQEYSPKILYTKVSDKMAYANSAGPDQFLAG